MFTGDKHSDRRIEEQLNSMPTDEAIRARASLEKVIESWNKGEVIRIWDPYKGYCGGYKTVCKSWNDLVYFDAWPWNYRLS